MLLDLCLIFLNPYTVHVLLNSIVKRLHAHTVSTDSYPSTSSGGGTQDYDGLPLLSQKLEDDERLIDLCSLYLLGKRESVSFLQSITIFTSLKQSIYILIALF